jgi:hypothetical protein
MHVYFSVTEMAAFGNTVNLEIRNQFNDASVTVAAPQSLGYCLSCFPA